MRWNKQDDDSNITEHIFSSLKRFDYIKRMRRILMFKQECELDFLRSHVLRLSNLEWHYTFSRISAQQNINTLTEPLYPWQKIELWSKFRSDHNKTELPAKRVVLFYTFHRGYCYEELSKLLGTCINPKVHRWLRHLEDCSA